MEHTRLSERGGEGADAKRGAWSRRSIPTWLVGMTMMPLGILGGLIVVTVPQMLSELRVPEAGIASVTALALSPFFWVFLVCPVLDVRFTRRTYAVAGSVVAALLLPLALANINNLTVLSVLLMVAFAAVVFAHNALGGWFSGAIPAERQGALSAWMWADASIGGTTVAYTGYDIVHHFSLAVSSALFSACIVLPVVIYAFIPAPASSTSHVHESFRRFINELKLLLARRQVIVALVMFVVPTSAFALTNTLGGLGPAFHATAATVSLAGGLGGLASIAGSLAMPIFTKRVPLYALYLGIGVLGALVTLSLLVLPRAPGTLIAAFVIEDLFQAAALTCAFAIAFQTVGPNNPLAGTTFAVLLAAENIPIVYMVSVDAHAFTHYGLSGSFAADAGLGILFCPLVVALMWWMRTYSPSGTTSRRLPQS